MNIDPNFHDKYCTILAVGLTKLLYLQIGSMPLPFPGMDKSGAAVCEFYSRGSCKRADACPLRHIRGDKTVKFSLY